jgi:anti-anti-sigma regulatory factor
MDKYELGLNKKSFSLFYNGGEIWCEHLDSLYNKKELLIQKFNQDLIQISKPSASSFIVIDLDESDIDKEILEHIVNSFVMLKKQLCKVVFVGLDKKMKSYIKKRNIETSFTMACLDDYEKAKEWLV